MTNEEIRSGVMGHLKTNLATATLASYVSWPNQDFKAPENHIWIRPVIKIPSTIVAELGDDGIGLRDCLFMLSIFVPKATGQKTATGWADRFEKLFRRVFVGNIWFDEPSSNYLGIDINGFYHVLMTVDFHTWVGE